MSDDSGCDDPQGLLEHPVQGDDPDPSRQEEKGDGADHGLLAAPDKPYSTTFEGYRVELTASAAPGQGPLLRDVPGW